MLQGMILGAGQEFCSVSVDEILHTSKLLTTDTFNQATLIKGYDHIDAHGREQLEPREAGSSFM